MTLLIFPNQGTTPPFRMMLLIIPNGGVVTAAASR